MTSHSFWSHFYHFFAHLNLFKLICGSDVDMIRNNVCIFLYPDTFIRNKFLDLFKDNEINGNVQNFCPPVYYVLEADNIGNIRTLWLCS